MSTEAKHRENAVQPAWIRDYSVSKVLITSFSSGVFNRPIQIKTKPVLKHVRS